jgi:hypothetical protein
VLFSKKKAPPEIRGTTYHPAIVSVSIAYLFIA